MGSRYSGWNHCIKGYVLGMEKKDSSFPKGVVSFIVVVLVMAALGGIIQISSGMRSFAENQKEVVAKAQIDSILEEQKVYKVTKLNIEVYRSIFGTYREYYVTAELDNKVTTIKVNSKQYYSLSVGDMINNKGERK